MPADSNNTGLLKGSCLFCPLKRKKNHGKEEPLSGCLTDDGVQSIKKAVHATTNERVINVLGTGVDLIAKEVQYHKSCRREFFKEAEKLNSKQCVGEQSSRKIHSKSWDSLAKFIETEVIEKKKPILYQQIYAKYVNIFVENGGDLDEADTYLPRHLIPRILSEFKDIVHTKIERPRGKFIHHVSLDVDTAKEMLAHRKDMTEQIKDVALYLNSLIMNIQKTELPRPTTHESLKANSPRLPSEILVFVKTLLTGHRDQCRISNRESIEKKMETITSDLVYAVSSGNIKP